MTPTQRTLALLRSAGYLVAVVERWNPVVKVRIDCYGFGDVLATRVNPPDIVLVQCTSTPNVAARVKKIRALPAHAEWLGAGGRILVIGWAKRGERGKRKMWTAKVVEVTLDSEAEVERVA